MDERSAQWLDDMFNSYGCYVVEEGVVRPIVLDEATVSHNHTEQLHSFEFSYKLSDSSTLLNLPRAEVLPGGLQIETPDQLFFLAPRLVEFPEAELDDSLLFLVQSPYEQNWKKITAGTLISSLQEYFENYSLTFAHTHNNLSVLNKFSESEDGKLLWNGEPIKGQGGGVDPEWQEKVDAAIVDINLLKSWFYEDAETGNIYLAKKNGAARNFVTFGDVVTGEGNEPGGDEPVVGGISSLVVKLGSVSYEGVGTTDVVVNLPAYPTELPASDVYAWAKQPTKPSYTFSEIGSKPTTLSGYGITDAYTKTEADGRYLKLSGGAMNGDITMTGHALVWHDQTAYDDVPTGMMGVSVVNDSELGYSTCISFKNYYGLQIAAHGAANNFYIRGYNHTQWNSWYQLLHTGNIGSFALTPSNYTSTLDSRYARTTYDNNLINHTNEFNFIPSGFSSQIAINYRTQGGLNGSVSQYRFYNGSGQLAAISVGGITINGYAALQNFHSVDEDLNTLVNSGVYRVESANINGPADSPNYSQMLVMHGYSDTIAQMIINYASADVYVRAGNPPAVGGYGTWTQWYTLARQHTSVDFTNITATGEVSASQMNATNGFYETSDARLKNFKDDIKALDVVSEIPTKYFIWKEDKNQKLQIGTSAQEVEKLYPELVSKTEDDILTVDYAKLSIVALAAIKELKTEIQSLKEEIKQLKSK